MDILHRTRARYPIRYFFARVNVQLTARLHRLRLACSSRDARRRKASPWSIATLARSCERRRTSVTSSTCFLPSTTSFASRFIYRVSGRRILYQIRNDESRTLDTTLDPMYLAKTVDLKRYLKLRGNVLNATSTFSPAPAPVPALGLIIRSMWLARPYPRQGAFEAAGQLRFVEAVERDSQPSAARLFVGRFGARVPAPEPRAPPLRHTTHPPTKLGMLCCRVDGSGCVVLCPSPSPASITPLSSQCSSLHGAVL